MTLIEFLHLSRKEWPSCTAIENQKRRLTYDELYTQAKQLSRQMSGPGKVTAIYADKNVETIQTIWATLLSRNVCFPINPEDPESRIQFLIKKSGAALSCRNGVINEFASDSKQLNTPAEVAYFLSTSGSTGTPKIVVLDHQSILPFVQWSTKTFHLSHKDRVASIAPYFFDLSTFDIFASAAVGATIVIPPEGLAVFPISMLEWLRSNSITVFYSVPSLLKRLAAIPAQAAPVSSVRWILFAGEVLDPQFLEPLFQLFPNSQFVNLYGPTETNVCTYHILDKERSYKQGIPIGQPCPYNQIELKKSTKSKDDRGGEILVRGKNVMRTYLNSHSDFQKKPTGEFSTGDWAYRDDNGELYFVGRKDRMIKRNGFRIELSEIEYRLGAIKGISVAVADAHKTSDGVQIGLAVCLQTESKDGQTMIRKLCKQNLPSYMIPDIILLLKDIPLLSNGKVDTKKISELLFSEDGPSAKS